MIYFPKKGIWHLCYRHFGWVAPAKSLRGIDVEIEAVLVLVPLQEVEQLLQVVHPAHGHEPLHWKLSQHKKIEIKTRKNIETKVRCKQSQILENENKQTNKPQRFLLITQVRYDLRAHRSKLRYPEIYFGQTDYGDAFYEISWWRPKKRSSRFKF